MDPLQEGRSGKFSEWQQAVAGGWKTGGQCGHRLLCIMKPSYVVQTVSSCPTCWFTYKPAIAVLGTTELTTAFTFPCKGWVSKERWGSESPSLHCTKKGNPSCRSMLSEQRLHVLHGRSYSLKTRSLACKADKYQDRKENRETGEWFANECGPT